MNTLLIAFCASCVLTFLLIRYQNLHGHISGDHDLSGPQKIHTQSVPRIGGAGIALGLLLGSIYIAIKDDAFNPIGFILLACIPVFGIGYWEDVRFGKNNTHELNLDARNPESKLIAKHPSYRLEIAALSA